MATLWVVPMFHYGGRLARNENDELVYADGYVENFEEIDVDHVNFEDLVKLYKSLGFRGYKRMFWRDFNAVNLEIGLCWLAGDDATIQELYDNARSRIAVSNEFYIDVEHSIDVPHLAFMPTGVNVESINLEDNMSSSSDDGGYESAEDEAYKPPPPGYEGDIDSEEYDSEGVNRCRKGNKVKKINTKGKG
ncbi:hypothetical protein PIB30_043043 [Stylosanthes scabra]|uniref:PB1-like domain-containing protein n=1 Tax=Stylosanthes scabra TaxID=79078 RepID=A0ABU6ZE53_9FABA|nr:hypothetical protein [Stylosanthes scabra]